MRNPSHSNGKNGSGSTNGKPPSTRAGAVERAAQAVVPPHLANVSWIDHECAAALAAYKDLRRELKLLKKKVSPARVHQARVTLRRWSAVWNVLKLDGWETDKYAETIGKTLKRLQSLLGDVRDLDVNLEQAQRLGCGKKLRAYWEKERKRCQQKLERFVEKHDIDKTLNELGKYLRRRPLKLKSTLAQAKAEQSAFDHIELYLLKQESIVRERAATARTPEELHKLRLSIKRWRYLLTEFFGLTNLELVRAQQILGQMHDLDRLTPEIAEAEDEHEALDQLKARRRKLLGEIEEMRAKLPYGLRPQIISSKPAFAAGLPR